MNISDKLERILAILTSIILLQTLFFKFSGAEESIYIFTKLNLEPYGRISTGIAELVTGLFLLFKKTRFYGGIMGLTILSGALYFHLTILGIEIQGDHGYLFSLAVFCFFSCLIITWKSRKKLLKLVKPQ